MILAFLIYSYANRLLEQLMFERFYLSPFIQVFADRCFLSKFQTRDKEINWEGIKQWVASVIETIARG